jgi:hypothetical protein
MAAMAATSEAHKVTICGMFKSAESILRRAQNEWQDLGGDLARDVDIADAYGALAADANTTSMYWLDQTDAQVSPADREEVRKALIQAVASIFFPGGPRPFGHYADDFAYKLGSLSGRSRGLVGLAKHDWPLPNGTRPDGTVYMALQTWVYETLYSDD